MAGGGDKGLPNGLPVDEWGIRANTAHDLFSGAPTKSKKKCKLAILAGTEAI